MSMDFRVDVGFFEHPKTMRLEARCGRLAPYHLLRLWAWARIHKPKGDLSGMTDDEIGTAAKWPKPAAFVDVLADVGLVDGAQGCRHLHDWKDRNGYAYHDEERRRRAQHAASVRWCKTHADGMPDACVEHQTSNAPPPPPSPSPLDNPPMPPLGKGGPLSTRNGPAARRSRRHLRGDE